MYGRRKTGRRRGKYDCKNIANIMKTLAYRGFIFKQTSKPF
uniref:ERI1 exoribonuclease family member 3 n=1 Tax=Rousettus aegyptiacus TaxID=9407 RepID=A0A7J8K7Z2_ROUAE|nr:ERI1 exoribonuclease family member 3 [Rousettus aegyptiacus]